ncbi:MAG: YraN family protein [Clostridia bacterium]|nr:YraN family protein [Clostridia bacterium]
MAECLNKRALGRFGEELSAQFYETAGFRTVARNWQWGKMGEIDLIVESPDQALLVFCEVKLRADPTFASAGSAVDGHKRRRIRKLAQCYLYANPRYNDYCVRFDVCEVYPDSNGEYVVNLIPEAF